MGVGPGSYRQRVSGTPITVRGSLVQVDTGQKLPGIRNGPPRDRQRGYAAPRWTNRHPGDLNPETPKLTLQLPAGL
jgi:hypothetical protein